MIYSLLNLIFKVIFMSETGILAPFYSNHMSILLTSEKSTKEAL